MEVLILGGTKFLGPHLVDAFRAHDHRVTLFNRGRTQASPAPDVETIRGDRDRDLHALAGRRWDAVVDTCGFVPRVVGKSARALADSTSRYVFISSISVYASPLGGGFDEHEPLATIADPTVEEITGETYGALKALSERAVEAAMPARSLIVRPGLIVGPLDPTGRFTYWPRRFALGGDVLVPGSAKRAIAFIDVRDLAAWIVVAVERGLAGAYNASGDPTTTTMGGLVEACVAAAHVEVRPIWVEERFLLDRGVAPWSDLPLWLPEGEDSMIKASSAKALAAGLRVRPIADTVEATLAWSRTQPLEHVQETGLTRERERELLASR